MRRGRTGFSWWCCVIVVCCVCMGTRPAGAQVGSGDITGVLTDPSGAAVPGATVTVTNVATNRQRVVSSTSDGAYTAASLLPGEYRLEILLSGFTPIRREGITVVTGQKTRVDFSLAVGTVGEVVQVTSDASMLRSETASLGAIVGHEQVVQLPLNGRTFITLATLAPGVALPPGSQLPRINGGRPRTNEYLFDGISVLQPEPGQVAFFPVIDAIQEFKIESNSPPAEFGRFNGGVVNLTTKSGTNAFHGNAFEFFRNEALNARNCLSVDQPGEAGVSPQPVRRHARRADRARSHLLLRGLPGPAAVDRTHRDLHGADGAAAPGNLHRSDRGQGAGHLRPGARPRRHGARAFPGNTHSCRSHRSGRGQPACSATRCRRRPGTANNYRRTATEVDDQDQWDARIDHRFGGARPVVRAALELLRPLRCR